VTTSWDSLLDLLASTPRENGTSALAETAIALTALLERLGIPSELIAYVAHPYRLRIAGALALLAGLTYAVALFRRRALLALAVAVLTPALLLLELDAYVPVFGWPGAQVQHHVEGVITPDVFDQHIIVAAHYDSKTDLLDHVIRAPIEILGLPIALWMVAAALVSWRHRRERQRRLRRFERGAAVVAALYGVFSFIALTGGAFASTRSPGTLDNGAATAVMVRLGERLIAAPPARTKVSLLFLSGEEIGVQGSWAYAQSRFATPPTVKTAVVNLEFLGAATDFGVFKGETFTTRRYDPDARLVEVFDSVHRAHQGKPLWVTWYSAATDARSFMAHGVPAMTLLNALPGHALPRGMHSPGDDRSRIVVGGLDAALALLEAAIRRLDTEGL